MSEIGGEIVIILLLIVANGIFALSEMAVITARKSRLQDWVKRGNRSAKVALELATAPNKFLSAVQVGITLVGILAGAFAGGDVANWMAGYIAQIPVISAYSQEIGLALVVLIITYFSLVIGELVPKRLALRHPETIATYVARPLRLFTQLSHRWFISWACRPMPFAGCLAGSTAVSRRLPKKRSERWCSRARKRVYSRSRNKTWSRRCCGSVIRTPAH